MGNETSVERERLATLQGAIGRLLARTPADLTTVEQLADQARTLAASPINSSLMPRSSSNFVYWVLSLNLIERFRKFLKRKVARNRFYRPLWSFAVQSKMS